MTGADELLIGLQKRSKEFSRPGSFDQTKADTRMQETTTANANSQRVSVRREDLNLRNRRYLA